jgi:hypothetical protein
MADLKPRNAPRSTPDDTVLPDDVPETEDTPEKSDQKWRTPEEDEDAIVYRQNYVDENGIPRTREHGPMPVADWPDYERRMENGTL